VKRLVIDASIAIKWVVQETGTDEALLLRRHRLVAPDLIVAECANVLWKKTVRGELLPEEASAAAQLLERADLELAPMRGLLSGATNWAIRLNHPAYDCLYLALADREAIAFVSADIGFVGKVRQAPGAPEVLTLQEAATQ
jgi:predicted nucleic acid-binding protein